MMKRWVFLAAALVLVACHDVPTVQTATAERRSLVVPILADGTLEPPPGGEVRAPEEGVVGAMLVREGQPVTRVGALIRLDIPDLSQGVLASRFASEHRAAAPPATLLDGAQLRAIADSNVPLVKSHAVTAFEYQQSEEKVRQADAQLADLTNRKQIADDTTRDLQSRAGQLVLRSPSDGVVYNLPRPGERVMPGQLVATVSDPRHIRVRARVDAPDLPPVRAGQRLMATS